MRDYREWIEFGKMYEALEDTFGNISISEDDEVVMVSVEGDEDNDYEEIVGISEIHAVEAIKELYFKTILGIDETDEILLDLNPEDISALYTISDQRRVPVDEIVIEALTNFIKQQTKLKNTDPIEPTESTKRNLILEEINDMEKDWIDQIDTSQLEEYRDILRKLRQK